jgi:hypothetical protein
MEIIIKALNDIGIENPDQIKNIATLIISAISDNTIIQAAEEIAESSVYEVEIIRQQILGGQ